MNTAERLVNMGSPVLASTDSDSVSMTAPEPLSQMPVTLLTVRTLPSTGIGWWSWIACSPWTSIVKLKSPMLPSELPPIPAITANVGSTCWSMPREFSVVKGSSDASSGSIEPAPTPTA